jgi:tetratricopeptide (TPR) repeat protein
MFRRAEEALTKALMLDPDYASGWAILGEVYIGGYFRGLTSTLTDNMLAKALECGKRAIMIDPLCQHGHQTVAFALLFLHDWERSLAAIREWEAIQPPSAGVQCAMGFILICLGEYEKGYDMATRAIELNPYYQWWVNAGMCFYHYQKGEFTDALMWAERMNMPDVPWWYLLMGCCQKEIGMTEAAERSFQDLFEKFPYLVDIMPSYVTAFLKDDILTKRFSGIVPQLHA